MKKFKITRKRMVVQVATFEIEVEEGQVPLEAGEAVEVDHWVNLEISPLSTEVGQADG